MPEPKVPSEPIEASDDNTEREAPGELRTVQEFINTDHVHPHLPPGQKDTRDNMGSPETFAAWLIGEGLVSPDTPVSSEELRSAREVREALRALAYANHGGPLDPDAMQTLDRASQRAELHVHFEPDGRALLVPCGEGVDAAIGRVLAIVYRSMADGTWPRFKACREGSCQWAFYDYSKNVSGAWCNMKVCGNRAKARAYRERHGSKRDPHQE
jgi:predicted RNA-binding Zn ribbon-like protein